MNKYSPFFFLIDYILTGQPGLGATESKGNWRERREYSTCEPDRTPGEKEQGSKEEEQEQ